MLHGCFSHQRDGKGSVRENSCLGCETCVELVGVFQKCLLFNRRIAACDNGWIVHGVRVDRVQMLFVLSLEGADW